MAKRYGVPYGMSKNRIARRLIDFLPPAEVFVDLMAGGCAVAHAALESRKYNHVIINDINPLPTQLFIDAVAGKYRDERRVIDRETFHRLKNVDPYVKYCWSFGSKGRDYLWGKDIEPIKLAACYMILREGNEQKIAAQEFQKLTKNWFNWDLLEYVMEAQDWRDRRRRFFRHAGQRIRELHGLERLENLSEAQKNVKRLSDITRYTRDYRSVPIPRDAVIYCDIPYQNTNVTRDMCDGFNYFEFYDWAAAQSNIFISSYDLPESRFEGVRGWLRAQSMSDSDNSTKVLEKLFVPRVA